MVSSRRRTELRDEENDQLKENDTPDTQLMFEPPEGWEGPAQSIDLRIQKANSSRGRRTTARHRQVYFYSRSNCPDWRLAARFVVVWTSSQSILLWFPKKSVHNYNIPLALVAMLEKLLLKACPSP